MEGKSQGLWIFCLFKTRYLFEEKKSQLCDNLFFDAVVWTNAKLPMQNGRSPANALFAEVQTMKSSSNS